MFQEDCLIVEYLAKVCELILQMRYDHTALAAAAAAAAIGTNQKESLQQQSQVGSRPQMNSDSPTKMGINLPKHQYRMINVIKDNWNRQSTAVSLEFFLQRKSDGQSKCVESWQLVYEKTEGKASNSVMKLAGLERSIGSLLVSTPLWSEYVSTDDRKLKNAFILDYKITFTKNTGNHNSSGGPSLVQGTQNTEQLSVPKVNVSKHASLALSCIYLKNLHQTLHNSSNNNTLGHSNHRNSHGHTYGHNHAHGHSHVSHGHKCISPEKQSRQRYFSDKLDPHDLLMNDGKLTFSPVPANHVFKKPRLLSDNFTFRYSFSDTEPLSNEDKQMINQHLKQSSVVSVYSRKDDITIVSTPEEIAVKMSSCDLSGFEIEMVLLEEHVEHIQFENQNYQDQQTTKRIQESSNSKQKKDGEIKELMPSQKDDSLKQNTASTAADDDFDFQLIEEESDRPIDLAIRRLADLINQHKIEVKTIMSPKNKQFQSAFDMLSTLTQRVSSF